jgi:hypothetical protein
MSLLSLSNELLIYIFSFVHDKDLVALCRVQKHINGLAEAILYQSISIQRFSIQPPPTYLQCGRRLVHLLRALILQPIRGTHIRFLDIQISENREPICDAEVAFSDESFKDLVFRRGESHAFTQLLPSLFAFLLTKIQRLQRLSIKLKPGDLSEALELYTKSNLTVPDTASPLSTVVSLDITCTEGWNGVCIDEIDLSIFTSVRQLFMQRCLSTTVAYPLRLEYGMGHITELVLYECFMDGNTMVALLSACNSLRVFGYHAWDCPSVNEGEEVHFHAGMLLSALQQHCKTLELLLLDFASTDITLDIFQPGLQKLNKLEAICVSEDIIDREGLQYLPAYIQTLCITNCSATTEHIVHALYKHISAVPKLKEIQINLLSDQEPFSDSESMPQQFEDGTSEFSRFRSFANRFTPKILCRPWDRGYEKPVSGLGGVTSFDKYLERWCSIVHYWDWNTTDNSIAE